MPVLATLRTVPKMRASGDTLYPIGEEVKRGFCLKASYVPSWVEGGKMRSGAFRRDCCCEVGHKKVLYARQWRSSHVPCSHHTHKTMGIKAIKRRCRRSPGPLVAPRCYRKRLSLPTPFPQLSWPDADQAVLCKRRQDTESWMGSKEIFG